VRVAVLGDLAGRTAVRPSVANTLRSGDMVQVG